MQVVNTNPPVQVTGRHVSVTEPIREYAVKKIEGLHLDYPRIIEAQVILDVEKIRHIAEVVLFCANHITIEASAVTEDLYASIDEAVSKISRRMRKYQTKLLRQYRPRKGETQQIEERVFTTEGFDENEESEPKFVRTEKYPVRPMHVDEAVLQLEMSTRQFLVFLNPKTEKVSVLYRRKDEGYGLIEPTF